MKLKLQLTLSELTALNNEVYLTLGRFPMEQLRQWWVGYCWLSSLKEVYDKTSAKVEHNRLFPTRTDKVVILSLTQAQALAIACTMLEDKEEPETGDALPFDPAPAITFENSVMDRIMAKIHQAYLV